MFFIVNTTPEALKQVTIMLAFFSTAALIASVVMLILNDTTGTAVLFGLACYCIIRFLFSYYKYRSAAKK